MTLPKVGMTKEQCEQAGVDEWPIDTCVTIPGYPEDFWRKIVKTYPGRNGQQDKWCIWFGMGRAKGEYIWDAPGFTQYQVQSVGKDPAFVGKQSFIQGRRKRVYIAHPLSDSNPAPWNNREKNVQRYLHFVALAMEQDLLVLTWVHSCLLWDALLLRKPSLYYLERDREYISMADELWACSPLEVSQGMVYEYNCAMEFGVPVRHDAEWDDFNWKPSLAYVEERTTRPRYF